jgi:membrane fusion protein, multidrug efflux system
MKKIVYLILLLSACNNTEEKEAVVQDEEIEAVSTVLPVLKTLKEEIFASGVLSSKSELKLAFKTGGMIKRMYVNEGQSVKKGQLLAELDMSEINAMVNQSKLGLQKAKRDLDRVQKMVEDEVATKNKLDDATTAFDVANETVQSAKFNQKLSRIYAPQSGRVLKKIAEQGELITPFAPALIIGTGENAFHLKVGLADRDIVKIKIGNPAEVTLDAYPGEVFLANVSEIAQMINPSTGTFEVELTMKNVGKKFISGFVAKAKITPPNESSVLLIPASSLSEAESNKAYVFVYNGSTVDKRSIKIGKIYSDAVQVLSGLTPNDRVVSLGANFLSQGQKVKVVNL